MKYFTLWDDKTAYEQFNLWLFAVLISFSILIFFLNSLGLNIWWEILVT